MPRLRMALRPRSPPPKSPSELGRPHSFDARLDDLIQQLGSTQFTVRRSAAGEIRKIGPEAFDRLHAATEDADPGNRGERELPVATNRRALDAERRLGDRRAADARLQRPRGQRTAADHPDARGDAERRGRGRRCAASRASIAHRSCRGSRRWRSSRQATMPSARSRPSPRSIRRSSIASWARARARRSSGCDNFNCSCATRPHRWPVGSG